jgi:hypothetical protein
VRRCCGLLAICLALLGSCSREEQLTKCQAKHEAFIDAKMAWSQARSRAKDEAGPGGVEVIPSERDEINRRRAELGLHQSALLESGCVTK